MTEIENTETLNNEIDVVALYGPTGKGIQSVSKTSTSGLNDTYTITYTDSTTSTFTLKNGRGISSLQKTSSTDLTETYTITYNDGTTSSFTVTNDVEDVNAVAAKLDDISTLAANLGGTNTVGTVAASILNVDAVGGNISSVNTVAQNSSAISTVAGISSAVTAVNGNSTNITTVADSITNVNKVGNSIGSVNDVAEVFDTVLGGSSSTNPTDSYDAGTSSVEYANILSGGTHLDAFRITPDDIVNINEIGNIKNQIEALTPTVISISSGGVVTLSKNKVYSGSEIASLFVVYPESFDETFASRLIFTSGTTATEITIPQGTKFNGDDVTASAFIPVANKRYECSFTYDGVYFRCRVSGV